MNIFKSLEEEIYNTLDVLKQSGVISREIVIGSISVEPPRDPAHGDVSTNAALVLAGPAKCKPRDLAKLLVPKLKQNHAQNDTNMERTESQDDQNTMLPT